MEDKDLQKVEEEEVKEKVEKKETETKALPEGFYLGEIVTQVEKVIVLDAKAISEKEVLIGMANLLRKQLGFMK